MGLSLGMKIDEHGNAVAGQWVERVLDSELRFRRITDRSGILKSSGQ